MSQPAIHAEHLCKHFRSNEALKDMGFSVPTGSIYGLLGPNGAGKTTTIKILMNLLTANSGRAEVLGCASHKLNWRGFQKIGYVSENQKLPEEMSVAELLAYLAPWYPDWDTKLCAELLTQLDLPAQRKLKNLSHGMKMKAALLSSLAFRPELLVLDEPFGGLDPVVREDFTKGLLGTVADSNGTVFMSSQDVEEVERLCDWVGIMKPGRLFISEPLDQLLRRFRRVELTLASRDTPEIDWGKDVIQAECSGTSVNLVHQQFSGEATLRELRERASGIATTEDFPMTLREIYLAIARVRTT
ncbi:MAG: ABC transporter ATP-binding protein [Methylacidiphilales bacterium]|nr:ABC transporter ATP-binding protein [Candidatus Methylacidiphilales bacterium]